MIDLNWDPMPYLGPIPINWYGITFTLAAMTARSVVLRSAAAYGFNKDSIDRLLLRILLGVLAGARLYYVLQNEPLSYLSHPWRIVAVWEGGLEMFATIELPTLGTHAALTVPTEAVQTINRRPVVFIKQDALHFAAREVATAGEGLAKEIVSGAKEGELVVTEGAYQLKSVFLSRQMQEEHEH